MYSEKINLKLLDFPPEQLLEELKILRMMSYSDTRQVISSGLPWLLMSQ